MLVQATNLHISYGHQPLIDHQNLYINEGDKIGVVGSNGQGKSTLLNIIAHMDEAYGTFVKKPDLTISYLNQSPTFQASLRVEDLFSSLSEQQGYRFKSYLTKFNIDDFKQLLSTMSGGNQRKVALALALSKEADLLILDEPTNHLDMDMILWLEKFLMRYKGAILMVTHDRYFLNRITPQIIEVNRGHLYKSLGGYQGYLNDLEMREKELINRQKKHAAILRVEKAWATAGVEARRTKSKDRLARYEALKQETFDVSSKELNIQFDMQRLGRKTITFTDVAKSFGAHVLFSNFNYQIQWYDRIGIVGDNGVGKTTLLNIMCGRDLDYQGSIDIGETIHFGYFDQMSEKLDPDIRAYDFIRDISDAIETKEGIFTAKQMMEQFLFDDTTMYLPIHRLSGGQKRRLYLLSVLMKKPNVLVLDEPTNDLDIETLTVLEQYIEDFPGILITVSHDRYFLDKVCDTLFVVENQQITIFNGSCSDYLANKVNSNEQKKEKVATVKEKRVRLTYAQQRRLKELSSTLPTLEKELEDINEQFNQLDLDYLTVQSLTEKQHHLEQELEELTLEWLELQEIQENGEA